LRGRKEGGEGNEKRELGKRERSWIIEQGDRGLVRRGRRSGIGCGKVVGIKRV